MGRGAQVEVIGILAEGDVMRILPIRLRTLLIMMAIVAALVAIWALLQELNRFLVAFHGPGGLMDRVVPLVMLVPLCDQADRIQMARIVDRVFGRGCRPLSAGSGGSLHPSKRSDRSVPRQSARDRSARRVIPFIPRAHGRAGGIPPARGVRRGRPNRRRSGRPWCRGSWGRRRGAATGRPPPDGRGGRRSAAACRRSRSRPGSG